MLHINDPSAYFNYDGAYSISHPSSKRRPPTREHQAALPPQMDFDLLAPWPYTNASFSSSMVSQQYPGQTFRDSSPFSDSSVSSSSSSWSFPSSNSSAAVSSSGFCSFDFLEDANPGGSSQLLSSNLPSYPPSVLNSGPGPDPFLVSSQHSISTSIQPIRSSRNASINSFRTSSRLPLSNPEGFSSTQETRPPLSPRHFATGSTTSRIRKDPPGPAMKTIKHKFNNVGEQKLPSPCPTGRQHLPPPGQSTRDQGLASSNMPTERCTPPDRRDQERWHCACGRSFTRYSDRKRHAEGSTSCPLAKEKLKQQDNGATSRFTCNYCQKSFSRYDSLARHQKNLSACSNL